MDAPSSRIGDITWGCEDSSHYLFVSTEPTAPNAQDGRHKAFDINTQRGYFLDAKETGDSIGIRPDGTGSIDSRIISIYSTVGNELALVTTASTKGFLRLYDINRKDGRHSQMIELSTNHDNSAECIMTSGAVYSPDGIYLALARNDNRTHVYDCRMLTRGILYDFAHTGPSKVTPGDNAKGSGITRAQWIVTRSSRLRLVTGGEDGNLFC